MNITISHPECLLRWRTSGGKGCYGASTPFFSDYVFLMKITIKLFGTLSALFPDYDFEQGLDVDLPEGSKVADLLAFLDISDDRGGIVLMDSRFLSKDEILTPGSQVLIFQALNGG
jgi:sulfur carrier protein ThiS